MKKLIIALTYAAVLSACKTTTKHHDSNKDIVVVKGFEDEISIITIDSCEYVKYVGYYRGSVTHKGNCKNPIHWKIIAREVN